MRIPIAVSLESRDGGVTRDAKILNGLVEVQGDGDTAVMRVRKRPGVRDLGIVKSGTGQLLYNWNGIQAIIADYLNAGSISTIISAPVQTNLSPTNAGLQFSAKETSPDATTPRLMFKNRSQAWTVNRAGAVSAVTYGGSMGTQTYNVVSLTRSGGTATATLSSDPGWVVGDSVTIAGATPSAYNGAQTLTAITPYSFVPGDTVPISSLTRVGTTATAVCSRAHGLSTGVAYTIAGATQSAYNGSQTVTVVDDVTFTYAVTLSGSGPDNDIPITITRSGTTATAQSSSAHGLSSGTSTIAGANQSEYNGSKSITVTDTTHFTFTVTVTPEAPASPATGSLSISSWSETIIVEMVDGSTTATVLPYIPSKFNVANGDTITISGTVTPNINGSYAVFNAASDGSSFQIGGLPGNVSAGPVCTMTRTPPTVSSITRSGSTATLTTSSAHKIRVGDIIVVAGADQYQYNGTFGVSVVTSTTIQYGVSVSAESPVSPGTGSIVVSGKTPANTATGTITVARPDVTQNFTFSYAIGGSPATPATGTITAQSNGGTVPGIPYINGYFCVMDVNGVIWNSNQDDPTTWGGTAFVIAQAVNGAARALARSNSNYLVAMKEWSLEYFYDAKSSPGSPFKPVEPGFATIGCASGDSVVEVDGVVAWLSQVKELGRSVHLLDGLTPTQVSTPDIERILNADDLKTVYALGIKIDGHALYLLTLKTTAITLVYDITSKVWGEWSSLSLAATVNVSSIVRVDDLAVVTTTTAHGLADGDPVQIAGANQTEYNGIFPALVSSATVFSIPVADTATTPATGTITAGRYVESYFAYTKYANFQGTHLFLHETSGHLGVPSTGLHRDAGIPIRTFGRSTRLDGGVMTKKRLPRMRIVGDAVDDFVIVRWSDDDSQTFVPFRLVDLSTEQPETRKCGDFRRRSLEFVHVGDNPLNLSHYELDIE